MPETISDTGPVLHLHEIGKLATLTTVAPVVLPDLVLAELEVRGLGVAQLAGSAQTQPICNLAQITNSSNSSFQVSNGFPAIDASGNRIAFSSNADLVGQNGDGLGLAAAWTLRRRTGVDWRMASLGSSNPVYCRQT